MTPPPDWLAPASLVLPVTVKSLRTPGSPQTWIVSARPVRWLFTIETSCVCAGAPPQERKNSRPGPTMLLLNVMWRCAEADEFGSMSIVARRVSLITLLSNVTYSPPATVQPWRPLRVKVEFWTVTWLLGAPTYTKSPYTSDAWTRSSTMLRVPPISNACCASRSATYESSYVPACGFAPTTVRFCTRMSEPSTNLNWLRVRAADGPSSRPLVIALNVAPLPSNVRWLRSSMRSARSMR